MTGGYKLTLDAVSEGKYGEEGRTYWEATITIRGGADVLMQPTCTRP